MFVIIILTTCKRNDVEDNNDFVFPDEVMAQVPYGKTYYLLTPIISKNDITIQTFENIALFAANTYNPDLDFFALIQEEQINSENRRWLRACNLQNRIIKLPSNYATKLQKLTHNYIRPIILVDGQGKILSIGNFLDSSYKQKLYNIINPDKNQTILNLQSSYFHSPEPNMDTVVVLKNKGKNNMYIYELEASCTCTKVSVDKKIIESSDSTNLHITYHHFKNDNMVSVINLYTNSQNSPHQIKIFGNSESL